MRRLDEPLRSGLLEITRRLQGAGIEFQVGGSLMLRLHGYDIEPGDIDLVVGTDLRGEVERVLHDLPIEEPPHREPWRTDWFLRVTLSMPGGDVGVDVMGGLALFVDGVLVRLPESPATSVAVEGTEIPLASRADWYHLSRVHNEVPPP